MFMHNTLCYCNAKNRAVNKTQKFIFPQKTEKFKDTFENSLTFQGLQKFKDNSLFNLMIITIHTNCNDNKQENINTTKISYNYVTYPIF